MLGKEKLIRIFFDWTKPRAPPWARLLQDECDFEKRRMVEERRRGIYRMSTQVQTKTKTMLLT